MPKVKISEFSSTPANNTDIDSINISEGCAPSGINDAIRELMAQLKDFQVGSAGDPVTVGGVLTVQAGSASTPALTTAGDTNTGMFFPAADTIAFAEGGAEIARFDSSGNLGLGVTPSAWSNGYKAFQIGQSSFSGVGNAVYLWQNIYQDSGGTNRYISTGTAGFAGWEGNTYKWYQAPSGTAGNAITFTQAMTLDASGNLGVGTTSPSQRLEVSGGDAKITAAGNGTRNLFFGTSSTNYQTIKYDDSTGALIIGSISSAYPVVFQTQGTERARIDSSGNFLVNTTTSTHSGISSRCILKSVDNVLGIVTDSGSTQAVRFTNGTTAVGSINLTTSTTAYSTSSDYRLKNTIAPMTGALAKVALLKPVTYKWNADGSDGEGFIAHELAEVVPQCVTGEKDAVDAEGNPQYQGIDTSFLVATLTAAIQELKAEFDAYKASHP